MNPEITAVYRSPAPLCLILLTLLAVALPASGELAEVGADDFRVSEVGVDGDISVDASYPAIVYNPTDDHYLVCWETSESNEQEIYCDLLTEGGGSLLSGGIEISYFGPSGANAANFDARSPAVAWDSAANTYLVCWEGDTTDDGQADNEFEIFCRQLDHNLGFMGGTYRVSDMDTLGDPAFDAYDPTVAYNFQDDNFTVCWSGDEEVFLVQADDEFEIFCRRLDPGWHSRYPAANLLRGRDRRCTERCL